MKRLIIPALMLAIAACSTSSEDTDAEAPDTVEITDVVCYYPNTDEPSVYSDVEEFYYGAYGSTIHTKDGLEIQSTPSVQCSAVTYDKLEKVK